MGDFGLYAALSGTDNWAQKRQDKMSNLMMLERMEQRSEKQLAAQMQAEAGIQEMLDKMSTFDVLPEDQKAIQQKEQEARLSIIKGITKFNGDLKRYMSSGGVTDLGEYQRSILTSSEMKNAVHNKAQYAQYIDAKQKDMFVGKAEIDVPVFDKNGNPKMKDGEIVRQRKRLTMEEQMALRKRGLLDRLQVGMIEKKGAINPEFFKKNFKDPLKPWSADNVVTEKNVYDYLISTGISEEQANQMANRYGEQHAGSPETAMKWNAMNPYELELLKSKIQYNLGKAKGKTGSGKRQITNTLKTKFSRLKQNPGLMMPENNARFGIQATRGASERLTNETNDYFAEYLARVQPKAYDQFYGAATDEERADGVGKYDLSNADVNLIELTSQKRFEGDTPQSYIKARVFYEDEYAPDDIDDYTYNVNNWRETTRRIKVKDRDEDLGYRIEEKDGWEGFVYIPIENEVYDRGFRSELAKQRNIGTNVQDYERGSTYDNMVQRNDENYNAMVQNLINLGKSKKDAEQIVQYTLASYNYQ
tara:strand:- start:113 stop:1708 length:1596 start_codon:yes stop_codon:yes gene_type:complete